MERTAKRGSNSRAEEQMRRRGRENRRNRTRRGENREERKGGEEREVSEDKEIEERGENSDRNPTSPQTPHNNQKNQQNTPQTAPWSACSIPTTMSPYNNLLKTPTYNPNHPTSPSPSPPNNQEGGRWGRGRERERVNPSGDWGEEW
eukprot:Lithocolla_globosa_v1_NODE_1949_length_2245_cov_3.221005.p1 type:complete len:147 gc:universal NODE_1949_length_2245_cov_3.221005:1412-1852(+)